MKKTIFFDMDGLIVDFVKGYKDAFNRSAYDDDSFTVEQFCLQVPHFFRMLPVNKKGMELFNELKDKYNIIFLTTPMKSMVHCRRDKILWCLENVKDNIDIIFNENKKSDYMVSEGDILIDDMQHNLSDWSENGGIAIDFIKHSNQAILKKIENVFIPIEKKTVIKEKINEAIYEKGQEILFKGIPVIIKKIPGDFKWFSKIKYYEGQILSEKGNIDCIISSENKSIAFKVEGIFKGYTVILFGFSDMQEIEKIYNSDKFRITIIKTKEIRESLL